MHACLLGIFFLPLKPVQDATALPRHTGALCSLQRWLPQDAEKVPAQAWSGGAPPLAPHCAQWFVLALRGGSSAPFWDRFSGGKFSCVGHSGRMTDLPLLPRDVAHACTQAWRPPPGPAPGGSWT